MGNQIDYNQIGDYSELFDLLASDEPLTRKRTRKDLLREFEDEEWGACLELFKSKKPSSLEDFLIELYSNKIEQVYFNGSEFQIDSQLQIQIELQSRIFENVKKEVSNNDSVIELGSGYGAHLIGLGSKLESFGLDLTAAELTENGRTLSYEFGELLGIQIQTAHLDFEISSTLDNLPIQSAVVYTAFSLMYSKSNYSDFMRELLRRKPKKLIIMEPLYEDFDLSSPWGFKCGQWMKMNDYKLNIKSELIHLLTKFPDYYQKEHSPLEFGSNPFLPFSKLVLVQND
jgi:hypothetical protein